MDEQAEELKSNQTDLTTRAEDMESRTIIVSLQEKEIQRKSQTQDDREARLAKDMTDFRQRTGALKEREAIANNSKESESAMELGIIIGGVAILVCCCFGLFLWYCCYRGKKQEQKEGSQQQEVMTEAEMRMELTEMQLEEIS